MSVSFVIFASGEGTNAQALMEFSAREPETARVLALISDRADAGALRRARALGVPARHVKHNDIDALLATLTELKPDWACLAGYMRILGKPVLDFFQDAKRGHARILNIHPSLLPAFPGLRAYEQAFAAGVPESGVTVHIVDESLDGGPIVLQKRFRRETDDDLASFRARGRALENDLYVEALRRVARGDFRLRRQAEGA